MEALFIFIAKSSGLLALFYFAYYFLLRKETFFTSNRWFLLAGLITALVLPLLVYTKIVLVDPTPISNMNFEPLNLTTHTVLNNEPEINWNLIYIGIYALGLVAFLLKFAFDYYSLKSILNGKKIQQQADFKFVDISENIAPFSYFDYIVYNSSMFSDTELENIIEHEKVHSEQKHSIDVLISRLFCVLFWFNPMMWLYKKVIVQNLEFIADSEAAKRISDKKAYQYTLLKITTHESCLSITNHFYQSLIKKRIVMLNKNQSKKRNSWKFCTVIPALVAFVFLFQIETVAQEKESSSLKDIQPEKIESVDVFTISKKSTDADIEKRVKTLKEKFDITATTSEVKRNEKDEITSIQVELKDKNNVTKVKKEVSSTGINKFGFTVISEKDGKVSFHFSEAEPANINVSTSPQEVKITVKNTQTSNTNNDVKINSSTHTSVSTFISTNTNVNAKPIIIVDGKEYPENTSLDELKPMSFDKMEVLKGEKAIEKYGEKGKDGVIVITTKKINNSGWAVSYGISAQNESIKRIKEDKNIDYKKAVIVIDGKVSDYSDLDKINPNHVRSISSPSVKNFPEAEKKKYLDKYGEKALNGVIQIETDPNMGN